MKVLASLSSVLYFSKELSERQVTIPSIQSTSSQEFEVQVQGNRVTSSIPIYYAEDEERDRGGLVLAKEFYLPSGRWRLWGVSGNTLLGPVEVEVKPEVAGTAVVKMCDTAYKVIVYTDGKYSVEEIEPNRDQKKLVDISGNIKLLSATSILADGTSLEGNSDLSSLPLPPLRVSLKLGVKVPVIVNAQKVGEANKTVNVVLEYTKKPQIQINGDKLTVDPAYCSCIKNTKVYVEFIRGAEKAVVELPPEKAEYSLLKLYLDKVDKSGLLWNIHAYIMCNGKVVAEATSEYSYVPKPDEMGAVVNKDKMEVELKPFPILARSIWYLDPEVSTSCTGEYVGKFSGVVECSKLSDEAKKLTYKVHTEVYAITPKKNVKVAEWDFYQYPDSVTYIEDVDGQRIPIEDKSKVEAFGKIVGKVYIKPKYYAVAYTQYGRLVIASWAKEPHKVEYGSEILRVFPSTVPVPTFGTVRVFDPRGTSEVELESPIHTVKVVLDKDWKWKLVFSKASTGTITLKATGVFIDSRKEVTKMFEVSGTKIDFESPFNLPLPVSASFSLEYTLQGADGNEYLVYSGYPGVEVSAPCAKSTDSGVAVDIECLLESIQVELVVEDKVPRVKVSIPEWFPSTVLVNEKEAKAGDTLTLDTLEVVLTLGKYQKKYKFEQIPPKVRVTDEYVEVESFGTSSRVEVSLVPLSAYAGNCKQKKAELTPDNPVLTKRDALEYFRGECIPKKVLVQVDDKNAVWQYSITEEGKWELKTKKFYYEGYEMQVVIVCDSKEYRYPDEIEKVRGLCPAYAELWGLRVPLGKPEFTTSVVTGSDGSKYLAVSADPLYFGEFSLEAIAYTANSSGRPVAYEVAKEVIDTAVQKEYRLPENAFEVVTAVKTPFGQKFVSENTVYGVESVAFVPNYTKDDYEVVVYVIATSQEPKRFTLAVITDTGEVVELYSTVFSGMFAKRIVFSYKAFKEKYKVEPLRLRATIDERAWYFDITGVQIEKTAERIAVSPQLSSILSTILSLFLRK